MTSSCQPARTERSIHNSKRHANSRFLVARDQVTHNFIITRPAPVCRSNLCRYSAPFRISQNPQTHTRVHVIQYAPPPAPPIPPWDPVLRHLHNTHGCSRFCAQRQQNNILLFGRVFGARRAAEEAVAKGAK